MFLADSLVETLPDPAALLVDPPRRVTLVIPGRDCAATVGACLEAATAVLHDPASALEEIIFVDDASTDATAARVQAWPVTLLRGEGRGPGAARNLGWRAATHRLVWFLDADCIPEPDALVPLIPHLADNEVAGVSGTYLNANPRSLLARLIHEEITTRHLAMPLEVDFLAAFNVLYRRGVLQELDGFDEDFKKAQDAELSFRARDSGYCCHFEPASRVAHFHATSWWRYLRTQQQQGYWRVFLHLRHRGRATRNAYSNLLDHVQPALALLTLAALPFALAPAPWPWIPAALAMALVLTQIPMTAAILNRTRRLRDLAFAPLGLVRAFFRGVGMAHGLLSWSAERLRSQASSRPSRDVPR